MGYGNVSVGTSATLIVAENKRRTYLQIYHNGTNAVFYGMNNSVTTANGSVLKSDKTREWKYDTDKRTQEETLYTGPIYGIVASGTEDVRYWEEDDTTDTRET